MSIGIGKTIGITFFLLFMVLNTHGQQCPDLVNPVNGATNVAVNTTISWESVPGVPAYLISLGTSPGGTELLNAQNVGNSPNYTPPKGLPENTTIYVTITLFFFNQPDIICTTQSFTTETLTQPPTCTQTTNPVDMATDVNPASNIRWQYTYGATGYYVSLGTTPGGVDILNTFDAGNNLSYDPPGELPSETTIYVTIVPYNSIGAATNCPSQSFTTSEVSPLPSCTSLVYPPNGEINVPLTPLLEWFEVPDATGYRVTIGSTPNGADILDNATFFTNSTPVLNFVPNQTFFIRVIPFNDAGSAQSCIQESFSTLLGCGPYLDLASGEFVTLNPEIDFPDSVSFCENEAPLIISSDDVADGFRWYQIDQFGAESLISQTNEVALTENGSYRYEAYNLVTQSGDIIECPTTKVFNVVSSESPTIERLQASNAGTGIEIRVEASGSGDYEYAVDNRNGPYVDDNIFRGLEPGSHTFYVRDKNGCGIAEKRFTQDLTLEGFPKFFTPNGDNINDFWQFIQPPNGDVVVLQSIYIFNRYGALLKEISQNSLGWDGNFNGRPLPAGEYWFRAVDDSNREIKGHFTLKR